MKYECIPSGDAEVLWLLVKAGSSSRREAASSMPARAARREGRRAGGADARCPGGGPRSPGEGDEQRHGVGGGVRRVCPSKGAGLPFFI